MMMATAVDRDKQQIDTSLRGKDIDPITFEIIRHRLFRTMQEQIIALKHITGSAITNEAHDVMVALYLPDGKLLMGGTGFLHHLIPAGETCRLILAQFGEEDINDGDAFMVSDPYVGPLHTSDVFVVTPIHHNDRLVAWTAVFVHVYDIGAINEGGFSPDARSVYDEGFSTKGLKILDRGMYRKDVMDNTFYNMVRVPEMVALDMASMVAAGNVARDRLVRLMDRYGAETLHDVGRILNDQSRDLLRARLLELPDGRWQSRQYLTAPDGTYTITLAMTKLEDRLSFDFSGSSPQAERYAINCSYWATLGGLLAPLFPLLCYDMTWNAGIIGWVDIVAPEKSIVNAQRPAPTSCATMCAIQSVNNLSSTTLSKMLMASEEHEREATGVWHGSLQALFLHGVNQKGQQVIGIRTETFAGSGGARTFADGVDLGGELPNPITRMENVETIEANYPIRYLFRRRRRDSAGPGIFRGGAGGEFAFCLHDAPDGLGVVNSGKGFTHPVADGIGGGYPAPPSRFLRVKAQGDPASVFAQDVDDLAGIREDIPWGTYRLDDADILYGRWSGGGGFGDPLLRDPEAVRDDWLARLVSRAAAEKIYGVILSDTGEIDAKGTETARSELRVRRMTDVDRS